jgi:hypothetical protein
LEGYKTCFTDYNEGIQECRLDFERIQKLDLEDKERQQLIEKWEKYQEEYYDPNLIIGNFKFFLK